MQKLAPKNTDPIALADTELVRLALSGHEGAFREIMRRNNQRLYRIARSVLRHSAEAEDAVQDAYISAFTHLSSYRGEAGLAAWLSRIVMNEALGRLRRRESMVFETHPNAEIIQFPTTATDPERTMAQRQLLDLVERATDELPQDYRTVFMARVIEGMSVEETAELLGLKPATVKTRLHRARSLVRERLLKQIGPVLMDAFPFAGRRCERMIETVMRRLGLPSR